MDISRHEARVGELLLNLNGEPGEGQQLGRLSEFSKKPIVVTGAEKTLVSAAVHPGMPKSGPAASISNSTLA